MQRKTFTRTLLSIAALAAALPLAAQAQATKLTLGHGAAPGNPRHEAAVKFAEVVKAKSAGRIEVQVAPSAQLGDDAAMVTAVRTGALDMTANSQGAVSVAVPEYAAFGMPFMFSTPAQAFKLLDGPLGQELAQKSADKGMVVLGYWDNGILKECVDASATDHSSILTNPRHAELALAYDVAIGVCRLTEQDWRELRVEADWRYGKGLHDEGHPHAYLSEYFQSGYINLQALNEWVATGEASRPAKVVDERFVKPSSFSQETS